MRAGIVKDPADYRYRCYGEAVSGNVKDARRGSIHALGLSDAEIDGADWKQLWKKMHAEYRKLLYGAEVEVTRDGRVYRKGATPERMVEVHPPSRVSGVTRATEKGETGVVDLLRKRVRYFTAGLVIGSRAFVNEVFKQNKDRFGVNRKDGARVMKGGDWGRLCSMRGLRKAPVG